jgi:hypothetical protein
MNEREPKVLILRPSGPRDAEVILGVVVSFCESVGHLCQHIQAIRVRGSGGLSRRIDSA